MSAEVPSKEEVLQGQLSVEQIKKAIETYTNENTDGYVARDDVTIRCKDERYTNTYYNIHCTTEEFIEGIKNAKISKDDKLACFDQMKEAMESQLLKRFDKEEIYSADFVNGYQEDLQQLKEINGNVKKAEKEFMPYKQIAGTVNYLSFSFFREGSQQAQAAGMLVNDALQNDSLDGFEKMKKEYPDFFKQNEESWGNFKTKLENLINPPKLDSEEMGAYKELLKKYTFDRQAFDKEMAEKEGELHHQNTNSRQFAAQQSEKYARFSEDEKKYCQIMKLSRDIDGKMGFEMENRWLKENHRVSGFSSVPLTEQIHDFVEKANAYFQRMLPNVLKEYQEIPPMEALKGSWLNQESFIKHATAGRKPCLSSTGKNGEGIDQVANQLASFQKIDKVKAEIPQMGLVNMMGGQSR